MANPYLEGVPVRARNAGAARRFVALWVLLLGMFFFIWLVLGGQSDHSAPLVHAPSAPSRAAATATIEDARRVGFLTLVGVPVGTVGLITGLVLLTVRRKKRDAAQLRDAEVLLACEQVDAAVLALRSLLPRAKPGAAHFTAMLALGRCAEQRGDFRAAYEMFMLASSSLDGPGMKPLRKQLAPLAAAHRAFAAAALGHFPEAEAALAETNEPTALPPTRARAVRSRALLLARRGEHKELLDLLARERGALRNALVERDRTLLRALEAVARRAIEGGTRAAAARVEVDPVLRPWIERAAPAAAAAWGPA
jgi:hypothetical protein